MHKFLVKGRRKASKDEWFYVGRVDEFTQVLGVEQLNREFAAWLRGMQQFREYEFAVFDGDRMIEDQNGKSC